VVVQPPRAAAGGILEGYAAAGLHERRPGGRVRLEVQRVANDDADVHAIDRQTPASEQALDMARALRSQPFTDVFDEGRGDRRWHGLVIY
jgi:hypothetical protein